MQTFDRAQIAGVDDVGLGALFGLYDYRFEVLALLQHGEHLERHYGAGPHTISIPRMRPADHAPDSINVPAPVSDADFKKLVAVIRCAVPYTGMILSTRESAEMRREVLQLGVSQLSAGSKTDVGGYHKGDLDSGARARVIVGLGPACALTVEGAAAEHKSNVASTAGQFTLQDHRPLDEVVAGASARRPPPPPQRARRVDARGPARAQT